MYLGLARFVLVSKEDDKNTIYRTDAHGQKGFVNLGCNPSLNTQFKFENPILDYFDTKKYTFNQGD